VSTVEEDERQRLAPRASDLVRVTHTFVHDIGQSSTMHCFAKERQRVDSTRGVDDFRVVPFPPLLVLFRPAVVIDRIQRHAALPCCRTKPHRGATAIRTNLCHRQTRNRRSRGQRCLVQRVAFVWRHESLRCECNGAQRGIKHDERDER